MSHFEGNLLQDEIRIAIVRKKIGCEIRFYGVRRADGSSALLGKTCQNDGLTKVLERMLEEGAKATHTSFLNMKETGAEPTGGGT